VTTATVATRADRLGGAVWMAFGLAVLVAAWRMDRFESMGANLYSAPGLVPGLYGALMVVMGAVLSWRSLKAGSAARGSDEPLLNRRVGLMLLLSLAYAAVAVSRLPFGPSTAVFVGSFCWLFDEQPSRWRRASKAALAGVLTAVGVVLVFERIFLVRLP
jgi:Tripartite tricarboxylate transporter TctB family